MILICVDDDLQDKPETINDVTLRCLNEDVFRASLYAQDVYFWFDGEVKPLKRRNAPA